ncbi:MAG TPA: kelch repeat-containing protein [Egibacteraceae bacterium]|nr:kelch repeat-containing protein [Egibacteraceae bacterium]
MDIRDPGQESSRREGWRQLLPVGLILAGVAVSGALLSPGASSDSAAILDIETGVSPSADEAPTAEPSEALSDPSQPPATPPHRDPLEVPDGTSSATDPSAAVALAPGEWSVLASPPVPAPLEGVTVWTGSEVITWGGVGVGTDSPRQVLRADGAAYSPAEDAWRLIAASSLTPRRGMAGAWTGAELLVWGGADESSHLADGAAYDPRLDQWRPLAASPLSARSDSAAVWTGDELLVIGGHDNGGPLNDAAAYDPRRDEWRVLSPGPAALARVWQLSGVWAGDSAVLWPRDGAAEPGARYAVDSDTWVSFPPVGAGADVIRQVLWTGEEMLGVMAGRNSGHMNVVWMGRGEQWEEADLPPGLNAWGSTALWTDFGLVILTPGPQGWLYEPGSQVWSQLPAGPQLELQDRSAISTGSELVLWEASPDGGAQASGAVFRFPSAAAGSG